MIRGRAAWVQRTLGSWAAQILNRAPGIAGHLLLNLRDASRHGNRAAFRWNMQRMGRELGSVTGPVLAHGRRLLYHTPWDRHRASPGPPTGSCLHFACVDAAASGRDGRVGCR